MAEMRVESQADVNSASHNRQGGSKLAFVTGASGFVGKHLVPELVSEGYEVRCLIRQSLPTEFNSLNGVSGVVGDLHNLDALREGVAGVDYVFHVAGVTGAPSEAEYYLHNVMGTRNVVNAVLAVKPPIKRFVFVSSQAAAGPSAGQPRRETDVSNPITAYGRSKLEAEEFLFSKSTHLPYIILRPSAVYGPGDREFLPIFKLLKYKYLIQLGSVDRIISLCHVNDLVKLMARSAVAEVRNGSTFFVADQQPYCWSEFERLAALAMKVEPRRVRFGQKILKLAGRMGQLVSRFSNRTVLINSTRIDEFLQPDWSLDVSKATNELRHETLHPLPTAINELVSWYQRNNWL
ncbi:MAG TPA: hypothetical protein DCY55_02765 [Gammaproteobacteria bacterium]|nr:hypothetical protein [Gammaproteobacteria bacterium]